MNLTAPSNATFAELAAHAARRLGINEAAAAWRLDRLALTLAANDGDGDAAVAKLAALGAAGVVALLAEGPHEQALALSPDGIQEAAGVGGHEAEDGSQQ